MKVIHGLENLPGSLADTVVAIGVFDGVHRGHQEILHQTVREARSLGFQPVVLTFSVHPAELLAPEHTPCYLSSLSQRAALIAEFGGGIAATVIAEFSHAFASFSPENFVSEILEGRLHARHVLVGADFHYGAKRAGNVTTLLESGAQQGFSVTVVPPLLENGIRISSTHIRHLLSEGDLAAAISLFGHSFVIEGQVVTGKKLGRSLGFPTANLAVFQPQQQYPGSGVYAAYAELADGRRVRAAVSVGINPTTDTDGIKKIEAYLLDGFADDLYGQHLSLEFRLKIRSELKFDNLDALISQMHHDVAAINLLLPR